MKSLNENLRELEVKKRQLEEQVDSLNEEVNQMKASEQMHKVSFNFCKLQPLLTFLSEGCFRETPRRD